MPRRKDHHLPGRDIVADLCTRYHGARGHFAYAALEWAQQHLYEDRLPLPLMQWALTPYGHCLGFTSYKQTDAVITLHPRIWRAGPMYTLDVIVHELLHVYIRWTLGHRSAIGNSSHDNAIWASEVMRLSPRLGLPAVRASRTVRRRAGKHLLRVMPDGCISRDQLATWPHSLRPTGFYQTSTLPFSWSEPF
jgi:hypothetical protein